MPREVISLHIGQAGSLIGFEFWNNILQEHLINPQGELFSNSYTDPFYLSSFFKQKSQGKYVPRSIFCDLDSTAINFVKSSSIGSVFDPSSLITGSGSTNDDYLGVFEKDGKKILSTLSEKLRVLIEECDSFDSIIITRSLTGGTGSGLTSFLLDEINSKFSNKKPILLYSCFGSFLSSEYVKQSSKSILNFALALGRDHPHQYDFLIDTQFVQETFEKLHSSNLSNLSSLPNSQIAYSLAVLTSQMRFPSENSFTISKICSLCSFPFISGSCSDFSQKILSPI